MLIEPHKQARTTPAVRAEIAASREPVAVLARRFRLSETQAQVQVAHRLQRPPHTAHRLQTTLTPAQELVVVELREAQAALG